jgi:predicted RNase H-like HicB family nuclease
MTKDEALKLAQEALEVLEKHRQIKGEAPMGMLGVRAIEELKEAFGLLHPQDDCEPPEQPATEKYTALEQALTRLQKRYGELEAKIAAQRQWVGLPDDDVYLLAHPRLARAIETKLKEKNT